MEILVQNCNTHLYLGPDGHWTDQKSQAMRFPSSADATLYCTKARIDHPQVLLSFGHKTLDLTLPLKDCKERR